jgi:hypothetical protein
MSFYYKMYNNYTNYLKNIVDDEDKLSKSQFKSNKHYRGILEHVSYELGIKYLELIQNEFINIKYDNILDFVSLNDKYGNPELFNYSFMNKNIICSPTTLRYVYHALTILNYYKNTECKNIVEVGCGYGGLCLAISFFSKVLNIKINDYNIIDLPEPCKLIKGYLNLHKNSIHTTIKIHSAETYGENITNENLFFISNYCYTEIDKVYNTMYSTILLPKTTNGFITWQNGGNKGIYPIEKCSELTGKEIINVIEEKPQTDAGYGVYKNYFVFF